MCRQNGICKLERDREQNRKELEELNKMSEEECQKRFYRSREEQSDIVRRLIDLCTEKASKLKRVTFGQKFFTTGVHESDQQISESSSPLFKLPPELRQQVYRHVVGSTQSTCLHVLGNEISGKSFNERLEIDKVRFEICTRDIAENTTHNDYNEYATRGYADLRFAKASRALNWDFLTTFLGSHNFVFTCPCSFNAFVAYLGPENAKLVRRITLALEVSDSNENEYSMDAIKALTGLNRINLDFLIPAEGAWLRKKGVPFDPKELDRIRRPLDEMKNLLQLKVNQIASSSVRFNNFLHTSINDQGVLDICEQFRQCIASPEGADQWTEYMQQCQNVDAQSEESRPKRELRNRATVVL